MVAPPKNRTILVVDDDPAFLAKTVEMLDSAGYAVLQATDGNRAVRLLEQMDGLIDLAIVDLSLPGLNGYEVIGTVARRPSTIKIIATTGLFKDRQLETAMALGAHAAIRKPSASIFPRQQWLGTIHQLIGEP